MKKGWAVEPLGDLCDILDSMRKPVTKKDRVAGEIPYYGATGIQDYVAAHLFDEPLVLVGEDGAKWGAGENTAFAVSGKCWVNNHAHVLRPDRKKVVDNWLIYYLNATDLNEYVSGLTVPKLNQGNLRQINIPVPPLPEQRRIVAILDDALEGIAAAKANAERNLRNAREVFESQREHLLSRGEQDWDEKAIGEVCEIKHGFAFQSKYFTDDGGYVCLTPGNFFEDGGYRDRGSKTKYYSGPVPEGFLLSAGQMLVAMTEQAPGLLGSPAIVPEGQNFLHNQRLGLICPKQGSPWVNEFFFHVFNRPSFRRAVHRTATGVKVRHTSPSKLGQIGVSFPVSERGQRNVATAIEAIQQQASCQQQVIHQKLAGLDELKASLLHQAFTGQL